MKAMRTTLKLMKNAKISVEMLRTHASCYHITVDAQETTRLVGITINMSKSAKNLCMVDVKVIKITLKIDDHVSVHVADNKNRKEDQNQFQ